MMTPKEKDFHLVQKALGGDNKACEVIYNKFYHTLNRQIYRIVNDSEVALDLTMETFEKVFTRLHRYQPDFCLSTWVTQIGTNCALDYTRRVKRVTMVSIDESYENDSVADIQVMDTERTGEERVIYDQNVIFLRGLLKLLPTQERRVLQCRYIDDMGFMKIGDELGISFIKVKELLKTAKQRLNQLAEEVSMREIINNKYKSYEEVFYGKGSRVV